MLTAKEFTGVIERGDKKIDLDSMAKGSLALLESTEYTLSDLQKIYNRATDLLEAARKAKGESEKQSPEVEQMLSDDDDFKNIDPMAL